MEALSHPELKLSETVPDFFGEHLDFRPLAPKDFSNFFYIYTFFSFQVAALGSLYESFLESGPQLHLQVFVHVI